MTGDRPVSGERPVTEEHRRIVTEDELRFMVDQVREEPHKQQEGFEGGVKYAAAQAERWALEFERVADSFRRFADTLRREIDTTRPVPVPDFPDERPTTPRITVVIVNDEWEEKTGT